MNTEQVMRTCGRAAIAADELDTDGRHLDAALIRALIAHLQDLAEDYADMAALDAAHAEGGEPVPFVPTAQTKPAAGKKRGRPPKAPAEVAPALPLGDAPPANAGSSAEPPAPPASASDPAPVSEIA